MISVFMVCLVFTCKLYSGGYTSVNAKGDGLDSKGSMYMTNCTVVVTGPIESNKGVKIMMGYLKCAAVCFSVQKKNASMKAVMRNFFVCFGKNKSYESEVMLMTIQSDIEKVIAYCEAAKGSYALMAQSTEEKDAKQMFNTMKTDIDRHIQFLNNRLEYLKENNELIKNRQ